MAYNLSKWGASHKKLAEIHMQKSHKLPVLPRNILDWIDAARPIVENKPRTFLTSPFWRQIYQDQSDFIMIMGGRQIFKSTACTDFLAFEATTNPGSQICYVTHDEKNLSGFSKQKLRIGTFLQNPVLSKFLRHPGNVGEVSLKNNSTIYLLTDNYGYRHLEGKSPTVCIIDEAQYQELENFGKVHQTMTATKGKLKIFGIGGEASGPYEKLWNQTNQMEWIYSDNNWRAKLQFDGNGLVIGDYLKDVLDGNWIAQNPHSELYHGYHLPQTIFPTIPLTEKDAIEKYKLHLMFSIEYQKKNLGESLFKSHVLGTFYKSPHRPITREMIIRCISHGNTLLNAKDMSKIKSDYGDNITISMGVDFGSGKSSSTVISIMILFKKSKRIMLAYVEKRPPENQLFQAQYIKELFEKFQCDIGVGDLGYGANQVKLIQDGGFSADGNSYLGVGDRKFYGCRTISDPAKPFQIFDNVTDEHGDSVTRIHIDKTSCIENLIDLIVASVTFNEKTFPKLIIPGKHDYEINFLLNDLSNVTRKDLLEYDTVTDPRIQAKKEYNHPPDSVMALIYSLVSLKILAGTEWHWISA